MYDFKPLLRDTALTRLTYSALFFKYNAPRINEMTVSTYRSNSRIFAIKTAVQYLKYIFRKRGAGEWLKTFSNTVFKQHFGKKNLKSILTGKVRKQFQTRAFTDTV